MHTVGKSHITFGDEFPGVELLSGNHLIQIAPSIHHSGHSYKLLVKPWEVPLADPPAFMVDELTPKEPTPAEINEARYAQILRMRGGDERLDRARAYLARVPGAIRGQGGWKHTNGVIVNVVRGFALSEFEAFELFMDWNASCDPPWKPNEIRNKIQWALDECSGELGNKLDRRRTSRNDDEPAKLINRDRIKIGGGRIASASTSSASSPASDPATLPSETERRIDGAVEALKQSAIDPNADFDDLQTPRDDTEIDLTLSERYRYRMARSLDDIGPTHLSGTPEERAQKRRRFEDHKRERLEAAYARAREIARERADGTARRRETDRRLAEIAHETIWDKNKRLAIIEAGLNAQDAAEAVRREKVTKIDLGLGNIKCIAPRTPILRKEEGEGYEIAQITVACENWDCGHCAAASRTRYSKHFHKIFRDPDAPVWFKPVSAEREFKASRKAIERSCDGTCNGACEEPRRIRRNRKGPCKDCEPKCKCR